MQLEIARGRLPPMHPRASSPRAHSGYCRVALLTLPVSPLRPARRFPGGPCRAQSASQSDASGLAAVPDCATGLSATLSDGVRIGYRGSDPDDPDRCLLDWSGRSYPLYFGLMEQWTGQADER